MLRKVVTVVWFLVIVKVSQGYDYNYCSAPLVNKDSYYEELRATKGNDLVLRHVTLVTRHGARAPCNVFPQPSFATYTCDSLGSIVMDTSDGSGLYEQVVHNDPSDTFAEQIWKGSCEVGQLMQTGQSQLVELGESLRNVYAAPLQLQNFTKDVANSIYIRSTDVWRTKQSAQSLMLGFFPASSRTPGLRMKFETATPEVDVVNPNAIACPALSDLDAAMYASSDWQKHAASLQSTITVLQEIFGTANMSSKNWGTDGCITGYFDNFHTLQCTGQDLPCSMSQPDLCVTQDQANEIYDAGSFTYQYKYLHFQQKKRAQLAIGPLLALIQTNMQNAAQGKGTKLSYYSGHDDTLAAMLGAFNQTDFLWPPYASHFAFEYWSSDSEKNDNDLVRILFNGDPMPLTGCKNPTECTLSEFNAYVSQLIVPDLQAVCDPIAHTHKQRQRMPAARVKKYLDLTSPH